MTDIFKCTRCRQSFIHEEFEGHICTPHITKLEQDIEFDYYYLTTDNKRETIVIKAMDGTVYGFVKREKKDSDKTPLV
jgi:hypothetical protein